MVRYWGKTLRRLNAVKINILESTLKVVCEGAESLEQLTIDVPRDMDQVMYLDSNAPLRHCHTYPLPPTVESFCRSTRSLQTTAYYH